MRFFTSLISFAIAYWNQDWLWKVFETLFFLSKALCIWLVKNFQICGQLKAPNQAGFIIFLKDKASALNVLNKSSCQKKILKAKRGKVKCDFKFSSPKHNVPKLFRFLMLLLKNSKIYIYIFFRRASAINAFKFEFPTKKKKKKIPGAPLNR